MNSLWEKTAALPRRDPLPGDRYADTVIIGAIMPIVPGAAFTIAIRDTLQGDYVAGSAKVLESLIKVAAIVVGAGLGMIMTGGFHV